MDKNECILITGMGVLFAALMVSWHYADDTNETFFKLLGLYAVADALFIWWFMRRVKKQYPLSTDKKYKVDLFPYAVTVIIALMIFLGTLVWLNLFAAVLVTLVSAVLAALIIVLIIITRAVKGDPLTVKR